MVCRDSPDDGPPHAVECTLRTSEHVADPPVPLEHRVGRPTYLVAAPEPQALELNDI